MTLKEYGNCIILFAFRFSSDSSTRCKFEYIFDMVLRYLEYFPWASKWMIFTNSTFLLVGDLTSQWPYSICHTSGICAQLPVLAAQRICVLLVYPSACVKLLCKSSGNRLFLRPPLIVHREIYIISRSHPTPSSDVCRQLLYHHF